MPYNRMMMRHMRSLELRTCAEIHEGIKQETVAEVRYWACCGCKRHIKPKISNTLYVSAPFQHVVYQKLVGEYPKERRAKYSGLAQGLLWAARPVKLS